MLSNPKKRKYIIFILIYNAPFLINVPALCPPPFFFSSNAVKMGLRILKLLTFAQILSIGLTNCKAPRYLLDLFVLRFNGPVKTINVISSRSVNLSTLFLWQASKAVNQYQVPILSPVAVNCLTWIRGRERMAVGIISWPNLHKRYVAGPRI